MARQRDVLQIHLFGGFSLSYDGEQLPPLASRHARLLFAWLVLQGGRPQPRTLLCDRFWPDVPESRARRRLSHALWQVQDAFGERAPDRPYLLTPGDAVEFDASVPYWVDVEEFEQRLDEVDRAGAADATGLRHLRRCVELYQGDLLAGSYEEWVLREQDRLRQRHVTALGRLVEACKQQGNFDEALAVARRLTHQAPLREESHREVMRLCVLLGQPSQAMEQFERCRSVLAEELGTEPSAVTLELYERIASNRAVGTTRRTPVEELATDRLVGRDAERVTLVDQLERTLRGTPGTVFLEGEAGVGKTQLLAQTVEDARWRGFTVLWGSCSGPDVPYAALRHAVVPELDSVRVAQLGALVAPVWLEEAGRLLPPLGQVAADTSRDGADLAGTDGAERMRQALSEIVAGLASMDPVVLVLEDLHRADPETLAVLRTLARRADPGRLLVLLSYRDVDARQDDGVWEALRELDRDARPTRLALEPLTAFETAGLLREVLGTAQVPAEFAAAVHRECGGNPLYVLELLRALRDTGMLDPARQEHLDTLSLPVTANLRTLIGNRLELLGADATDVAEFGAVLGQDFELSTLQVASDLSPRKLTTALGELVRRNLLQLEAERCRFSHSATRRVLLDGLDEARARALHTTAADALEATRPEDVEDLASHLRAAGLTRRALPYVRRAAERALELHAYTTAARHLEAALELGERVPMSVADRAELLLQAETVLDVLGRRDEQAAVLDQLTELAAGDPLLEVEVAVRRATHLGHVNELARALEVARSAVDRAPAGVPRGRALTSLGSVLGWTGDNEQAAAVLLDAVPLLEGRPGEDVRARHALGTALRFLQHFDEADEQLAAALVTAQDAGDQVGTVQVLGALADLRAETGATDEAVELYDRAVALARQIGFRHREGVSLVNLGTVRIARGEPAASLSALDEAEDVFRALGNHRGTAMVRLNRAWLCHRWLGRDDSAEQDATAARRYFEEIGSLGLVAPCMETLAGIARRRGDLEHADEYLAHGLRAADDAHDQRAAIQLVRGKVETALCGGDVDRAVTLASAAVARATELELNEFVADLASLAAVAALNMAPTTARDHARTAELHLATSSEPHRIHHRLATVAERLGNNAAATSHHRTAHQLLSGALGGLDERTHTTAIEGVPEHRAIVAAGLEHTPRTLALRLARTDAPRGRALAPGETTDVALELAPPPASPEVRRAQLIAVLRQVESQGAEATVDDLATVFDVSASTIRRDLRSLREQGHDATTRGSRTG